MPRNERCLLTLIERVRTLATTAISTPPLADHHYAAFRDTLLAWYDEAQREMPWRQTRDPYRIWISEIMLQQTRVDQAQPYYERFVAAFPTVEALAAASLDDVLVKWEGLGYYARARNMHKAAKKVVSDFAARVPDSYDEIRSLPGIGPYTAAAVLSIAYKCPYAVLDGNVIRVLTRVFAISDEVGSARTKRNLQAVADTLLTPERPGDFNQAMMELGATICTPVSPDCLACPLRSVCKAFAVGSQSLYPVKKKKAPVPHYDIAVGLVFDGEGRLLIQQRPTDKMLGGLWEFPGGKQEPGESLDVTCQRELREELGIEVAVEQLFQRVSHAFTHFKITLHAFRCNIIAGTPRSLEGQPLRWVAIEDLSNYAFPRANRRLIEALDERVHNPTLFD